MAVVFDKGVSGTVEQQHEFYFRTRENAQDLHSSQ